MTIDEVINGKVRPSTISSLAMRRSILMCPSFIQEDGSFPGLLGVVDAYLNSLELDVKSRCEIRKYLDLIKRRANGRLLRSDAPRWMSLCGLTRSPCHAAGSLKTPATYYREYILAHPAYKHDSVVNSEVCYDLAKHVDEL